MTDVGEYVVVEYMGFAGRSVKRVQAVTEDGYITLVDPDKWSDPDTWNSGVFVPSEEHTEILTEHMVQLARAGGVSVAVEPDRAPTVHSSVGVLQNGQREQTLCGLGVSDSIHVSGSEGWTSKSVNCPVCVRLNSWADEMVKLHVPGDDGARLDGR